MRWLIPPMTPEDAATSVLNICMHAFNNKQPWDEARSILIQLINDARQAGYEQAKQEIAEAPLEAPLPEVQVVDANQIDKTV